MNARDDSYVFIHIGKTAGSAVRGAVQSAFRPEQVCPLVFQDDIAALTTEDRQRFRLYCAHVGFDTASQLGRNLFTVLRDPVDRTLSQYYYWREVTGEGLGVRNAKALSLDAFLDSDDAAMLVDLENLQTWQLACAQDLHTRERVSQLKSLDQVYQAALDNVAAMDVVGVQENLPLFMDDLTERYGWYLPPPPPVNVTNSRLPREDISLTTRKKIHRLVEADIELYAYVLASRVNVPRKRGRLLKRHLSAPAIKRGIARAAGALRRRSGNPGGF
ncbi:MAG: sulfotransferase family 2 domain-containing protein [Halieaceae bacterium]|jgi:hypothetical protein|nr:sulfotransferase family 2 domain-containing protein [Halieaceae bacterium]